MRGKHRHKCLRASRGGLQCPLASKRRGHVLCCASVPELSCSNAAAAVGAKLRGGAKGKGCIPKARHFEKCRPSAQRRSRKECSPPLLPSCHLGGGQAAVVCNPFLYTCYPLSPTRHTAATHTHTPASWPQYLHPGSPQAKGFELRGGPGAAPSFRLPTKRPPPLPACRSAGNGVSSVSPLPGLPWLSLYPERAAKRSRRAAAAASHSLPRMQAPLWSIHPSIPACLPKDAQASAAGARLESAAGWARAFEWSPATISVLQRRARGRMGMAFNWYWI